jgi:hypothetical protein
MRWLISQFMDEYTALESGGWKRLQTTFSLSSFMNASYDVTAIMQYGVPWFVICGEKYHARGEKWSNFSACERMCCVRHLHNPVWWGCICYFRYVIMARMEVPYFASCIFHEIIESFRSFCNPGCLCVWQYMLRLKYVRGMQVGSDM